MCLPVQGTRTPSLVREDPQAAGQLSLRATNWPSSQVREPVLRNKVSHLSEKPPAPHQRRKQPGLTATRESQ